MCRVMNLRILASHHLISILRDVQSETNKEIMLLYHKKSIKIFKKCMECHESITNHSACADA